jgi:hypothetical protein
VTPTKLADSAVSIVKLKKRQAWKTTTTIAAGSRAGFNVLAVPLSSPRGATILVHAYTTTAGGRFKWSEESTTGGAVSDLWINQNVAFENLSTIPIEVVFTIYELDPA